MPDEVCYLQMPHFINGNLRPWIIRMQGLWTTESTFRETSFEWLELQMTFREIAQALAHVHAKGNIFFLIVFIV